MTTAQDEPLKVLFIDSGNSARSIMAEAIVNRVARGRFKAWSAGARPRGEVNPVTLDYLRDANHPVEDLRSKSWDEFGGPDAPRFDFIITLCDEAAGETPPVWPGHPISSNWPLADPVLAKGTEAQVGLAFAETYRMLTNRIGLLMNLPLAELSRHSLQHHVDQIGKHDAEAKPAA